jgi:hypothetical protein
MQSITRFITQKLKLKVNDFCAGDFGVQPNATPPGDHFRLAAFVHRGRD